MQKELTNAAHIIFLFCRLNMQRRHNTQIKPAEMHVLIFIHKSKTAVTPVMISDFFNVTKPFVTKTITSLEKNNYVCKTPSPQDNRSYQLALTQKGKQLLEEGFKQFLKTIELLKSQMGTDNFLLFLQQLKTANKILMENK